MTIRLWPGPRRWLGLIVLGSACAWSARAEVERHTVQFGAQLLLSAPVERLILDGRLDEPAWVDAAPLEGFSLPDGAAPLATVVKALHDSDRVYLGIRCEVPSRESIVAVQPEGGKTYRDDSIEIFWDPANDGSRCFQLVVNAAAAVTVIDWRDMQTYLPRGDVLDARAAWDAAATSYTLEVGIRRAAFGLSGPLTHAIGVAFLRNQQVRADGNRVYRTLWRTPTPAGWGHLFLMDPAAYAALQAEYRTRLAAVLRAVPTADYRRQAEAMTQAVGTLPARDRPALAEFEQGLLRLEDDVHRQYWHRKFAELFQ